MFSSILRCRARKIDVRLIRQTTHKMSQGAIRMNNEKIILCRIGKQENGMTLGQYLKQEMHFTKNQISSMKFRNEGLMVNGERARVNRLLKMGDEVKILLENEEAGSAHLEISEDPLEILYEDKDVLAVWKESGVVVHPSHGHFRDTLSNRVYGYFKRKGQQVQVRSIGRLDKDTCGIVVFAKNQIASSRLWKQKEKGLFWKEYLAFCEGGIEEKETLQENQQKSITAMENQQKGERAEESWQKSSGAEENRQKGDGTKERQQKGDGTKERQQKGDGTKERQQKPIAAAEDREKWLEMWQTISAPIAPIPGEKMKMCVAEGGKRSVTHYKIWKKGDHKTLLRVRIETGRTHQIRVHMAYIGHPVVGDPIYGSSSSHGLCLCAWKTEFFQPFTGERINLDGEKLLREKKWSAIL